MTLQVQSNLDKSLSDSRPSKKSSDEKLRSIIDRNGEVIALTLTNISKFF
jgi:hypothetical protein